MIDWWKEENNLRRLYIDEKKSIKEISKIYGTSGDSTIRDGLKMMGIIKSNLSPKICKHCGRLFYPVRRGGNQMYCCPECKTLDDRRVSDEDIIKSLNENNWNYSKTSRSIGISDKAIQRRMNNLGLYKKRQHDWTGIVNLETAQAMVDKLGIQTAKELRTKYSGLTEKLGNLKLLSKINYPPKKSNFDSIWEGDMYEFISKHSDILGYSKIFHNIILDEECKYKSPLKFDIVLEYEDNSKIVIEIQGPTHFKKMYKEKSLEYVQERDRIKREYCLSNNINLLYFTYDKRLIKEYGYEYPIYTDEFLLLEKLKEFSSIKP